MLMSGDFLYSYPFDKLQSFRKGSDVDKIRSTGLELEERGYDWIKQEVDG